MREKKLVIYRQHVVAFLIDFLFLLGYVKLAEKVESDDGVNVDDDSEQHDGQNELFAVVGDSLQDDTQGGHSHRHVQQVGGEKEVIVVAENREAQVPQLVQERLQKYIENYLL